MKSARRARRPSSSAPAPQGPAAARLTALLALVALTIWVFADVRFADFVNLDDPHYVLDNPHVTAGLSWAGIVWAFTTGYAPYWHPLTWISHMLDVQMFGLDPGGHHLTSLALHLLNSVLLLVALQRMTGAFWRSAFVAGVFAVHPLHVESVAWVAERKDVLSTLCFMLVLVSYAGYARAPSWRRYVVTLGLFAVGLLAKPMLVTLPVLLLLVDVWPLHRVTFGPMAASAWWPLVREKLPFFVVAAAACLATFLIQQRVGAVGTLEHLPFSARVVHAIAGYASYLRQSVWPVDLAAFHPYPLTMPPTWLTGTLLIAGAAITAACLRASDRRPWLLVGWLWFVVALLPVIGFVQVGIQATADRFMYVPIVGLALIVAWLAHDLAERSTLARRTLPAVAIAIILALAVGAHAQVASWKNSETLWTRALAVTTDNYYADGAMGAVRADQDRVDDAIVYFTRALTLKPDLADVRLDLGEAYARQGRTADAAAEFSRVVRDDPGLAEGHHNYAVALAELGHVDQAVAEFTEALRINPELSRTHSAFGRLLLSQGRVTEAIGHLRAALALDPSDARSRALLDELAKGRG